MTNSEKQTKSAGTESAAAPAASFRAAIARRPTLFVFGVVLLVGWGFSLHINNWHLTVPVVMLWLAWLGALFTVRLLWDVGIAVAGEAGGQSMQELDVSESRRIELEEEKKSLIRAIKEIEFDRDLGKMSDEDATEMMRFYRARAIEVIKELAGSPDAELSVQERIDRDLAARLAIEGAVSKGAQKERQKSGSKAPAKKASSDAKANDAKANDAKANDAKAAATDTAKSADPAASADPTTTDTPKAAESEDLDESSKLAKSAHEEPNEAPLESA